MAHVDRRGFLKASLAGLAAAASPGAHAAQAPGVPQARTFSLAYLTVFGCPPPEMTYLAGRAGYDFVSLRPISMNLPGEPVFDLARDPVLLRQTRTALAATGLRVHDIELARIGDGVDARSWQPALEVGAALGAQRVISSIWTADRTFALEAFATVCELARPLGLTIDLEFVTFANLKTLRDARDFLDAARQPNVGILVDMLHCSRSRVPLAELDGVPRDLLHFVHVCDGAVPWDATDQALIHTARDERLYLGEGGIDVAAIMRRLPPVVCSIELPHTARVREMGYAEHAFRCLETTKAYFSQRGL
ncbi:MAG: sugar phosphate isomerase/epimerase [Vicinamibacterales bacterium]